MWLPSINVNGGYGYKSLHSDGRMSPREKNVYNESLGCDAGFTLFSQYHIFPPKSLRSYLYLVTSFCAY